MGVPVSQRMYEMTWHDETQTVIHLAFGGKAWRWDQFDRAVFSAFSVMQRVPYGVVMVLDLHDMPKVAEESLKQIERVFAKAPHNLARLVIISEDMGVEWHYAMSKKVNAIVTNTIDNLFD